MHQVVEVQDIAAAAERLSSVVTTTPLHGSRRLGAALGRPVWLKREDQQVSRSYKLRGAFTVVSSLSEADRALTEALADTTGALDALDVARGRDEIGPRLAALDRALRRIDLPASLPARAQRTVATSSRLLGVLALATETDGGAVTAAEAQQRMLALRPLRTAVRYALCAAYSAAAEPARPAR